MGDGGEGVVFFGFIYVHIPVEARILLSALRSGHCGSEDFSCDNACQRLLVVALMLKALLIAHFFVSCIPAENRRQKKPCRRCVSVCVCGVAGLDLASRGVWGKKTQQLHFRDCVAPVGLHGRLCLSLSVSFFPSIGLSF